MVHLAEGGGGCGWLPAQDCVVGGAGRPGLPEDVEGQAVKGSHGDSCYLFQLFDFNWYICLLDLIPKTEETLEILTKSKNFS